MNFRFIRKQVATLSMATAKRSSRRAGIGAIICAALGISAFAQGQLDFIDPLDDERVRIEKTGKAPALSPEAIDKPAKPRASTGEQNPDLLSRAREGATSGAAAAQEKAGGLWSRMRAAVGDVAESLGLPTAGLLGLLGLLLAGIACLVGWTLFRGNRSSASSRSDGDIYQRDGRGRGRRKLGDMNPLTAKKKSDPEESFEETMPEDFDTIFRDEAADAVSKPVPPKTMDSGKWRKPNLDRLRESIRTDWKADKADTAKAGLAGAGVAAAGMAARSTDPADRALDDVCDGWEEWDTQVKPEDDPWGETLVTGDDDKGDDDGALQRIRALRESLKAS